MRCDLVALIHRADSLGGNLGVIDSHALADELSGLAEKVGIKIEGTPKTVFIEKLDESLVLSYAIVIAEGYCLFLTVKIFHFVLLGTYFAGGCTARAIVCAQNV